MVGHWARICALLLSSSLLVMPAVPANALGRQLAPQPRLLNDPDDQTPEQPASEDATAGEASGWEVAVEITTPGQRANVTFEGSVDQVVTVVLGGSTIRGCWTRISIFTPAMTELESTITCNPTASLRHVRLPANGAYTLVLTPAGVSTGTASLTVYTVVDDVGVIQADGSPVAIELTTPGQLASYSFAARAGQIVTAVLGGSTIHGCWTSLTILKPDQTKLDSVSTCGQDALLTHRVLPADGTYTLTLIPAGVSTGRATLTLYTLLDVEESIPDTRSPRPTRTPRSPSR